MVDKSGQLEFEQTKSHRERDTQREREMKVKMGQLNGFGNVWV